MSDPCSCILCVAERGLAQAEKDRDAAENRYESALDARLADAALAERAAIVTWLRDTYRKNEWAISVAIERAEHIEDTDRMTRLVTQLQNQLEEAGGRLDVAYRHGGQSERAAIVAWLRAKAERAFLGERDPQDSLVGDFATWIERGEHLAGDDV